MGNSCCAVGCTNRLKKGSGIQFYRFPEDKLKRGQWVAAVGCKNWNPMQYSWICSAHFVSGSKSNDPLIQIMFLPFLTMSRFLTKKKEPEMNWTNLEEDQKQIGGGCHMVRD